MGKPLVRTVWLVILVDKNQLLLAENLNYLAIPWVSDNCLHLRRWLIYLALLVDYTLLKKLT